MKTDRRTGSDTEVIEMENYHETTWKRRVGYNRTHTDIYYVIKFKI